MWGERPSWLVPVISGVVSAAVAVAVTLLVVRCTAQPAASTQQPASAQSAQGQDAGSGSASSNASSSNKDSSSGDADAGDSDGSSSSGSGKSKKSGSSTTAANVPDPAWKEAAGVDDLTSDGTDPTAEAAELEAERVAKNEAAGYEGVEDPWTDSGLFSTGDKELDQMVKEFCDSHTTKGQSASENAYNTFCNIYWSDYVEWEGNQHPHTYDWQVGYAKDFFDRGGNCFSMAAAIQWCLRYFGYSDAHAELTYQLRQSGGMLDHGLTWVTDLESGDIKMVDSEAAANGWMMKPNSYTVEILDPTGDWEPRSSAFTMDQMT